MGLLYGRARLGYVALCEGNLDEGYQILRNTALQFFDDGSPTGLAFTLERLAPYFTLSGDSDHAVRLIGWADATRQHSGDIRHPNEQAEVDRDMDKCKAALGEAAFRQAYAQGQTATLEQAARLADR